MLLRWAVCKRHCPQNKYINKPVQLLEKWAALWFSASSGDFLKGLHPMSATKDLSAPSTKDIEKSQLKLLETHLSK